MTTANIIRMTHPLFIFALALGACQGGGSDLPGAGLGDEETSGDDDDGGDVDDGVDGNADDASDEALGCGNGVVEASEECDDDNSSDVDGCMTDCRFGPSNIRIDTSNPTELPQKGNLGGGSPSKAGCANGEIIIGIEGRAGALLDRVAIQCGRVQLFDPEDPEVLDLTIVPSMVLQPSGGSGGSSFRSTCPEGHAVVGFSGRTGSYIDQLTLSCALMSILDDGQSMTLVLDEPFEIQPVGGSGGGPFEPEHCEEGQVATIANLRSGALVDAFGLTCMSISLAY